MPGPARRIPCKGSSPNPSPRARSRHGSQSRQPRPGPRSIEADRQAFSTAATTAPLSAGRPRGSRSRGPRRRRRRRSRRLKQRGTERDGGGEGGGPTSSRRSGPGSGSAGGPAARAQTVSRRGPAPFLPRPIIPCERSPAHRAKLDPRARMVMLRGSGGSPCESPFARHTLGCAGVRPARESVSASSNTSTATRIRAQDNPVPPFGTRPALPSLEPTNVRGPCPSPAGQGEPGIAPTHESKAARSRSLRNLRPSRSCSTSQCRLCGGRRRTRHPSAPADRKATWG